MNEEFVGQPGPTIQPSCQARHGVGFTDSERLVLIQEIGRTEGLSFGEALELVERLLGGSIFSSRGTTRREPVDTGHLGMLIHRIGTRKDLPDRDRRVLMRKLASAGTGPEEGIFMKRTAADILAGILGSCPSRLRRRTGTQSGRRQENAIDLPGLERAGRIVRNLEKYLVSMRGVRQPETYPVDFFDGIEVNSERLTRAILGDPADTRSRCRRVAGKRGKNTFRRKGEYDSYSCDPADTGFARWLWEDR
jgi:hypothetical protein